MSARLSARPSPRPIHCRTNPVARLLWQAAGDRAHAELVAAVAWREACPVTRARGIARAVRLLRLA